MSIGGLVLMDSIIGRMRAAACSLPVAQLSVCDPNELGMGI